MFGYIYETTNLINGKKYIGKHKSNKFDTNYLGSGIALKRAINKYGKENFEVGIIEEINTNQEDLDLREMYYIKKYNAVKDKNYYNHSYGGENEGWDGVNKAINISGRPWTKTQSFKDKMRQKQLGKEPWMKGKHHTKESIEKNRQAHLGVPSTFKGKHHTEETKRKISEKCKGYKHTEKAKIKMKEFRKTYSSHMLGKHHSEESKLKISEEHKGRKWFNDGINEYFIFPYTAKETYILGRIKRRNTNG